MIIRFALILYLIFKSTFCFSKILLPQHLSKSDRRTVLSLFGAGTSARLLSTPYPLGGWEGFEIGLSKHFLPTQDLIELGNGTPSQDDFEYPLLTLGKGLFYDLDLFLSLIPMGQNKTMSHFSSQIRYQVWNSSNQIFRISGLIHGGTTTLNNQLNMQSYGFNVLGTATIDRLSLFIGIGSTFTNGQFIGCSQVLSPQSNALVDCENGITDTESTQTETLTLSHQVFGVEWPIDNFFIAAEVDRYRVPFYSFKIGYRM